MCQAVRAEAQTRSSPLAGSRMMGSLLWCCIDGLSGLLRTEGTAPPSSFPQWHNPPAFFLPVRLNIRLNYRSDGERKKNQLISSLLWLVALSPLFFNLQTWSFFSLFLVALIGLGGAVIFEMLGSHGMGEGRADCTKSRYSSRLHTALWKPISDIKSNRCSLGPDRHRKIGAWWIFT